MHTPVLFDDAEDIPETFGFVHITRKPDVLHLRIQIKHLQVVPTGKGGKKVFQPHIAENNPPVFPGGMQISVDLPFGHVTVCLLQTLVGEAYFDVHPDASHPFTVISGPAEVTVLGTSFNLRAYPEEDIVTTLVSGAVQMSEKVGGQSVRLTPGEQGCLEKTNGYMTKHRDFGRTGNNGERV